MIPRFLAVKKKKVVILKEQFINVEKFTHKDHCNAFAQRILRSELESSWLVEMHVNGRGVRKNYVMLLILNLKKRQTPETSFISKKINSSVSDLH